jgi:hypothetical protein
MNRKELEELIDSEVSKVFSDMVSKEPQEEKAQETTQPVQRQVNLSEEEFDEIFFGKKED